jgi:hypothetical protein
MHICNVVSVASVVHEMRYLPSFQATVSMREDGHVESCKWQIVHQASES